VNSIFYDPLRTQPPLIFSFFVKIALQQSSTFTKDR
jgi:hypothetical protein